MMPAFLFAITKILVTFTPLPKKVCNFEMKHANFILFLRKYPWRSLLSGNNNEFVSREFLFMSHLWPKFHKFLICRDDAISKTSSVARWNPKCFYNIVFRKEPWRYKICDQLLKKEMSFKKTQMGRTGLFLFPPTP